MADLRPAEAQPTYRELINRRFPDLEITPVHYAGNSSRVVHGTAAKLYASTDYAWMVLGTEGTCFVSSIARRVGDAVVFGGIPKVNTHETSNQGGSRVLVVGFDESSASHNALAYAIGIAHRNCCDVVVVQVNPTAVHGSPMDGILGTFPGVVTSVSERLGAEVVARLEEVVPGRWRLEVRNGDPAVELERIGEDLRSDVIVIGRSRGAVRHPLGSVTGRLIRRAKRPVIVVP